MRSPLHPNPSKVRARLLAGIASVVGIVSMSTLAAAANQPSQQEISSIARDAYIYGYPLVLQDITRQQSTNVQGVPRFPHSPANRLSHARAFPPVDMHIVIRPNVDTLYSAGWLDLKSGPVVLSVPATDRYFMLPMLSMWTDIFAVPGTRTTGANRAVNLLVVPPGWAGDVPAGLDLVRAPTRYVGIIGRIKVAGASDYAGAHEVQARIGVTPLAQWGRAATAPASVPSSFDPAVDMKTPPPKQVDRMDATIFFRRFTELMKENPPAANDYPILHRMERLGLKAGETFDLGAVPAAIRDAIEAGVSEGRALLERADEGASGKESGWSYTLNSGAYGSNYLYRAGIARCCLGENLPEDAVYPSATTDSKGRALDGHHSYVVHFSKGQLPPVDGFWSLTAYDKDGYFIPNAIQRQALGDRDKLVANADGSTDLYIQSDSPAGPRASNWLPVGRAPFSLMLRLYAPKESMLEGRWTPPRIQRVE